MPNNEYITPEIGQVMAMLSQSCDELTRQALVRGITAKTQEWIQGDPELLDILQEGKKTLEECVRYVTEKAAFVIAKNINAMRGADVEQLPRVEIQGNATMAGGAIDDGQVYKWAQEYYYDPEAKPRDFIKEAEQKAETAKRAAEAAKASAERKAAADKKSKKKGKAAAGTQATDDASTAAATGDGEKIQPPSTTAERPAEIGPIVSGEQLNMFASAPDAEAA